MVQRTIIALGYLGFDLRAQLETIFKPEITPVENWSLCFYGTVV